MAATVADVYELMRDMAEDHYEELEDGTKNVNAYQLAIDAYNQINDTDIDDPPQHFVDIAEDVAGEYLINLDPEPEDRQQLLEQQRILNNQIEELQEQIAEIDKKLWAIHEAEQKTLREKHGFPDTIEITHQHVNEWMTTHPTSSRPGTGTYTVVNITGNSILLKLDVGRGYTGFSLPIEMFTKWCNLH